MLEAMFITDTDNKLFFGKHSNYHICKHYASLFLLAALMRGKKMDFGLVRMQRKSKIKKKVCSHIEKKNIKIIVLIKVNWYIA